MTLTVALTTVMRILRSLHIAHDFVQKLQARWLQYFGHVCHMDPDRLLSITVEFNDEEVEPVEDDDGRDVICSDCTERNMSVVDVV